MHATRFIAPICKCGGRIVIVLSGTSLIALCQKCNRSAAALEAPQPTNPLPPKEEK